MSKAAYLSPSLACCPLERLEPMCVSWSSWGGSAAWILWTAILWPTIALAQSLCRCYRITRLPLDIHLMVQRPGAENSLFCPLPARFCHRARRKRRMCTRRWRPSARRGRAPGCAEPATPLEACRWVLDDLDLLLIMTINPGFAGQKLVAQTLEKLRSARKCWTQQEARRCWRWTEMSRLKTPKP